MHDPAPIDFSVVGADPHFAIVSIGNPLFNVYFISLLCA